MNQVKNRYMKIVIAVFFSCWGIYLRYLNLSGRGHTPDELTIVHSAIGSLKPFWQRLTYMELTAFPGLYVTIYPFMRIFGNNKWGLAIPHIISALVGFYFLYQICQKYCKTLFGFAVPFIFVAFNHSLIYHSFELRPYAVLPTLALGCFYLSDNVINKASSLSLSKKVLIGLFFIFTVLYHVYGIMIVVVSLSFFIICLLDRRNIKEIIKEHFLFVFPIGVISVLIFLWYASGTVVSYEQSVSRGIYTFEIFPSPTDDLWRFLKSIFSRMMGFKKFKIKLLIYGLWLSFLFPQRERLKRIGFFLMMIIIPLELMLIADLHNGYWFLDRQFTWQMPLFAFLLGWSWDVIITSSTGFLHKRFNISRQAK